MTAHMPRNAGTSDMNERVKNAIEDGIVSAFYGEMNELGISVQVRTVAKNRPQDWMCTAGCVRGVCVGVAGGGGCVECVACMLEMA